MPRYLTGGQVAALARTGWQPVLLVRLCQSVPGVVREVLWASQSDGTNPREYHVGADEYGVEIASAPSLRTALLGEGGVSVLDGGELAIANPDASGTLWTDGFETVGPLDGSELEFGVVLGGDGVTEADVLWFARGAVERPAWDSLRVRLPWLDASIRQYAAWPTERFDSSDYAYAPTGLWRTVKPVVFGNRTGRAFDITTPATFASWRHVPAPLVNGMTQEYFLRDIGTANAQEEVMWLTGVPCTIPSGSRTLAGETLQVTDGVVEAWLRPHRTVTATNVTASAFARADDEGTFAVLAGGGTLKVAFPGLSRGIGLYGAADTAAASDCRVYVVHSTASGTGFFDSTVSLEPTPTVLDEQIGVSSGTAAAVMTASIGAAADLPNGLEDLPLVRISLDYSSGSSIRIHRILMRVVVRSEEALAAFDEQRVLRSQRGFIESASAARDDYQDGGYIDAPGTARRATALENPADIVEAVLRNRNFGLGLRAPRAAVTPFLQYQDPSAALAQYVGDDTVWQLGNGEAASFCAGDTVLVNGEVVRVASLLNLLTSNSGFELGNLTGWTQNDGASLITDTVQDVEKYEGTYAYCIESTGGNAGRAHSVTLSPNTAYTVSCWAKCVTQGGAGSTALRLRLRYDDGEAVPAITQESVALTDATDWTRYSFTHTTGAVAEAGAVTLYGIGEAYFDGVQIEVGSAATAYQVGDRILVDRAVAGSGLTTHPTGSALYLCPVNGDVDCASFRGAAALCRHPSGVELLSGGAMEGPYAVHAVYSIADGWTYYDPSAKGLFVKAAINRYTGRYSQEITRGSTGGYNPAIYQTFATTSGRSYRVRFRAKSTAAYTAMLTIGDSTNFLNFDLALTSNWQVFERQFIAWGATTWIYLRTGSAAGTVYYDDASVQLLEDDLWAPHVDQERSSRDWFNEVLPSARLRLGRDQYGRASARVWRRYRVPRETWGDASLVIEEQEPRGSARPITPVTVRRLRVDDVPTGVTVRYGWDEQAREFRRSTWIGARLESTGQVVTGVSGNYLTVDDASEVYPATGWESRTAQRIATSGTHNRTLTFSTTLGTNEPTFVTHGIEAGAWVAVQATSTDTGSVTLSQVESVGSETAITVRDQMWAQVVGDSTTASLMVFPCLYVAGGRIFVPRVSSGPGTEHATEVLTLPASFFDRQHFGTGGMVAVVGDPVERLYTYSDDGLGVRDQGYRVDVDRERVAAYRLALRGSERTDVVEAPWIYDRATAVAYRDYLFDVRGPVDEYEVVTHIGTVGVEEGDFVRLEHAVVRGGSAVVEVVERRFDLVRGLITSRCRTLPAEV